MRSCIAVIGAATFVLVGAIAAWFYRDDLGRLASDIVPGLRAPAESVAVAGPELARRVEEKIIALGQGDVIETSLSEEELNGWITHGLQGFFPSFLTGVSADLSQEDIIGLSGRVIVREVPGIERLGPMLAFLGDTADVSASGSVDGLEPGRAVFTVESVRVGALPLPERMRDQLLAAIRGGSSAGEAVNEVAFQVPAFVVDLALRDGELVLRRAAGEGR